MHGRFMYIPVICLICRFYLTCYLNYFRQMFVVVDFPASHPLSRTSSSNYSSLDPNKNQLFCQEIQIFKHIGKTRTENKALSGQQPCFKRTLSQLLAPFLKISQTKQRSIIFSSLLKSSTFNSYPVSGFSLRYPNVISSHR